MAQPSVNVGHNTFRVSWSPDDSEYVGTCDEFPSLSWLADDRAAALDGIECLVADIALEIGESGEGPPIH